MQVCAECGKTADVNEDYICGNCADKPPFTRVVKIVYDNGIFIGRLVEVLR